MISWERLQTLLSYDLNTGYFTNVVTRGSKAIAGKRAGSVDKSSGYRYITIDGYSYSESRLAYFWMTGIWPPNEIDHINRVRDDNRWCNLRLATRVENQSNITRKDSTLPVGVYKDGNKWRAQIRRNGKILYLGRYDTVEVAREVYLEVDNLWRTSSDSFDDFCIRIANRRHD